MSHTLSPTPARLRRALARRRLTHAQADADAVAADRYRRHAHTLGEGLARSYTLLSAQNAALQVLIAQRDEGERRRGFLLRALQDLARAEDPAEIATVTVAAARALTDATDVTFWRGDDAVATIGAPVSIPSGDRPDDAWVWVSPNAAVVVLRVATECDDAWVAVAGAAVPLPLPVQDDLVTLAEQASTALARCRALAEARRQAAIARAVVDAVPAGIALCDGDGGLLMSNQTYDALAPQLDACDDGEADDGARGPTARAQYDRELRWIAEHPDAQAVHEYGLADRRTFTRFTVPVHMPDGSHVGRLFVHRDVTAERAAARAQDEFLALVSHELRTPLTSIVGYLELLGDGEAGPLGDEQARAVGIAAKNARRLQRMVGDLLVVAQARAGGLALITREDDLARCVADAIDSALPAAHARGIALHGPSRQPVPVMMDAQRIGQVLDNLLANAVHYGRPGDAVTVDVTGDVQQACVTVRDTGPGIPPDDVERVFEHFYRGEGVRAVAGTGLGLPITRALVEAHGGSVRLSSTVGQGTTFVVCLPRGGPAAVAPEGDGQ